MADIASPNPFESRLTRPKLIENISVWVFRFATYLILLAATYIFFDIAYNGSKVVFSSSFPFVNTTFLTQETETLYVFEYQGEKMKLSASEWVKFKQSHDVASISPQTYSYSGGGIFNAIVGTVLLVVGSMIIALILGIFCAIYLSEYSKPGPFIDAIRLAIVNLAGVPSIVFGLFGYGMFVLFFGWGVSLLAGWFTLAFMVLPVIITASEESLSAVPKGFREGSLALGSSKWQSIYLNVLPYALPGILTSSVLGIARVAGETAPIMFTAAFASRDQLPWEGLKGPLDFFFQGVMALPYHIYVVSTKIPQNEYTRDMQYGTAFVFLTVVLLIALSAILLRIRMRKLYKW